MLVYSISMEYICRRVVHALSFGDSHIVGTENGVGSKERKRAPSNSPASPI